MKGELNMLKISNIEPKVGLRVTLPEDWHEKVVSFGKVKTFAYDFEISQIVKDKATRTTYYICKPEKKEFKQLIAFTETPLRYLKASEVPDQNVGLSFKEFLPLENTHLLITSVKNPNEVIPGFFKIETRLVQIENKSIICLDFQIDFTNGSGFSSVQLYCEGSKKATWKFLYSTDTSCMTDYEQMFQDTMVHKMYVIKSCEKLASWLEREGATYHAAKLRARAKSHDISKLNCEDEINALSRIIHDKSSLKDANNQLSPIKKDAIKLHWKHNTHHPEFYKTPIDMSKLDIMEMCCDWYARSMQYNTNFLEYVKTQQEKRFHFPEWMFAEIWFYCKVLASEI